MSHSTASSPLSFAMVARPEDDPFWNGEDDCESSASDDEIVWSAQVQAGPDEDFILVPYSDPHALAAPAEIEAQLEQAIAGLTIDPLKAASFMPSALPPPRKGRRSAAKVGASPKKRYKKPASNASPTQGKARSEKGNRANAARKGGVASSPPAVSPEPSQIKTSDRNLIAKRDGLSSLPFVEDDERHNQYLDLPNAASCTITTYEDAVRYITSFLSNPSQFAGMRLTLLQSLIVEFGLVSPSAALPSTMKAAKQLLKSHVFINIGTWLSVRGQGLDKLKGYMFPTRGELAKDLRRRRRVQVGKGWVKEVGLSVLLVSVF